MLQTAARTDRVLMKVVSQAENEITRRNQIEGIGSTGHVSIYAFDQAGAAALIPAPLQGIVQALPAEAPRLPVRRGGAAADEAVRTAREGSRGRRGARLPDGRRGGARPQGRAAAREAEYVLAVLEEARRTSTTRCARRRTARLIQRLLKGGHGKPHAVAMAVLGPAAAPARWRWSSRWRPTATATSAA